jgi:hypothetical protein
MEDLFAVPTRIAIMSDGGEKFTIEVDEEKAEVSIMDWANESKVWMSFDEAALIIEALKQALGEE